MHHNIKNKIRQFIEPQINQQPLEDNSDIFQLGYVNSLFAMQLVSFIENEFYIKVKNEELDINNFNCIDNLTTYITGKLDKSIQQ